MDRLVENGHIVHRAKEDADVLIASSVAKMSSDKEVEDTNVLVLLCFHTPMDGMLIFRSEIKGRKAWNVTKIREILGELTKYLSVAHCFLGSGTVSRIFGMGKGTLLKKIRQRNVQRLLETFIGNTDKNEIANADEEVLLLLMGRKETSLNEARVNKFIEKVASSKVYIEPSRCHRRHQQ